MLTSLLHFSLLSKYLSSHRPNHSWSKYLFVAAESRSSHSWVGVQRRVPRSKVMCSFLSRFSVLSQVLSRWVLHPHANEGHSPCSCRQLKNVSLFVNPDPFNKLLDVMTLALQHNSTPLSAQTASVFASLLK